jgi:hypothetical protein
MKVHCSCCAKQITNATVPRENKEMTVAQGAKAGFGNQKICGYCAEELDENGLYPEELAIVDGWDYL